MNKRAMASSPFNYLSEWNRASTAHESLLKRRILRAQEQVILVYPNPASRTFIQSRSPEKPHQLVVSGEQGMIAPGSIAVNVEQNAPDGFITYSQGQVSQDGMKPP